MKVSLNTYIISDWHLGHKNVIKYANRENNHEQILIDKCNEVVTKNDKLLVLGDLTFLNKKKTKEWTDKIKCKNKFLIRGNHDGHSESWYKDVGFELSESIFKIFKNKYDKYTSVLFTHKPVVDLPDNWINIHGHIHRGLHRKEYWPYLTDRHINVSCEVLDFIPKKIKSFLH